MAAGAIVHYLRATKQGALEHLDTLRFYEQRDCLELDAVSVRNLELVDPLFSERRCEDDAALDARCVLYADGQAAAARAAAAADAVVWLSINARLEAVAAAAGGSAAARRCAAGDGWRAWTSSGCWGAWRWTRLGRAKWWRWGLRWRGCRACVAAAGELGGCGGGALGGLCSRVRYAGGSARDDRADAGGGAAGVAGRWRVPCARVSMRSSMSCAGFRRHGRQKIAAIEERERERTGIGSLKVRFNSVFGYYLEVTKANAKSVPRTTSASRRW